MNDSVLIDNSTLMAGGKSNVEQDYYNTSINQGMLQNSLDGMPLYNSNKI